MLISNVKKRLNVLALVSQRVNLYLCERDRPLSPVDSR